jgi:hypothetical protein
LINDLPLFIDPFLLFGSEKAEYKSLHDEILNYLGFLKTKSEKRITDKGQIKAWYMFPEVKQNWLGYSLVGNSGSGLGKRFADSMSLNMHVVFSDLGKETITSTSHLEKAGLFEIGVGRDNISDFTCNLIKSYLLAYTETFAKAHIKKKHLKKFKVNKVYFDYRLEKWMPKEYTLPYIFGDFVVLTPKDILTKDDNWINGKDLRGNFDEICSSVSNDQLRAEILNYFSTRLPKKKDEEEPTNKELAKAIYETLRKYPKLIDYYIKLKEENKKGAKTVAKEKVKEVEKIFIENVSLLIKQLKTQTDFYKTESDSYKASLERLKYLKDVIENNDGYKLFYIKGKPIKREADLQIIFKFTWFASSFDVNREPNNGRGPVDYTISKGSKDKSLVEFKLASNSKLRQNLENQVKIYETANKTKRSIKVIMYFDQSERIKTQKILKELKLDNDDSIVTIDASRTNKKSASTV